MAEMVNLRELLMHGEVLLEVTKADNTKREMLCTRDFTKIPEEFHPKMDHSSGVIRKVSKANNTLNATNKTRVFDLRKNAWRVIQFDKCVVLAY